MNKSANAASIIRNRINDPVIIAKTKVRSRRADVFPINVPVILILRCVLSMAIRARIGSH
jgi:hypothetical protein